ncbi:MAG: hypothetical protein DRP42_01855 [Tenericutes bacterium]|nr:MAG: hypothetical protein DRP42_01855 [Mycoplasmatota bacterium]
MSRYGISEFAASLDTVSYFTNTVEQAALLLEILQGKDEQDLTANEDNTKFSEELNTNKKYKIGY